MNEAKTENSEMISVEKTKETKKSTKDFEKIIDQLNKHLNEKSKLAEDRLTQLKYLQADFDNYRKKFDKEKEDIIKLANENLVKELIIIVDEFELSLNEVKDEKIKKGLELIHKNLLKILDKHGLKQIECLGKKFDHNYHEVLMKENSDKDGIVLEEFQKGYMLRNKVIRTSKVKIGENLFDEKASPK